MISWLRFEWPLRQVPDDPIDTPAPFSLRRANPGEEAAVLKVLINAFSMDTGWSDIQKAFAAQIARNVTTVFELDPPSGVVLLHGARIIGASLLNPREDAESHLAPGPCILHEYRGRGLGTLLLRASLSALKEAGLPRAFGVARDKTAAARFVYPKFGGASTPWTPDFAVVPKLAA